VEITEASTPAFRVKEPGFIRDPAGPLIPFLLTGFAFVVGIGVFIGALWLTGSFDEKPMDVSTVTDTEFYNWCLKEIDAGSSYCYYHSGGE